MELCGKMTQLTIKKDKSDKEKLKEQQCYNERMPPPPKHITDRCLQTTAWILLIVGLCILMIAFSLTILAKTGGDNDERDNPGQNDQIFVEFNSSYSRAIDDSMLQLSSFGSCQEMFCNVACMKTENIFETLHAIVSNSVCESTSVLWIEEQEFPASALKNNWIRLEHPVLEVFISSSDLSEIKSNAFNTPMFSKMFLLSLHRLKLSKVDSGALLGLFALKYLTIDSNIQALDSAFFQPVQTTLTHLKLTAGLKFQKDHCIFQSNIFPKLEYLDLSRNIFNVPLRRKMFLFMPRLSYLIITNAKITSIEENAFAGLKGRLRTLNLAYNFLTTISSELLTPLLVANPFISISLAGNTWKCDCDIQPLVEMYKNYRSQFVDTLYCKVPTRLYGTLINFVNFTAMGCDPIETSTALTVEDRKNITTEMAARSTTPSALVSSQEDFTKDDEMTMVTSSDVNSQEEGTFFKMRCLNTLDTGAKDSDSSTSVKDTNISAIVPLESFSSKSETEITLLTSDSNENRYVENDIERGIDDEIVRGIDDEIVRGIDDEIVRDIDDDIIRDQNDKKILTFIEREYMQFEPPSRVFELELFPNCSVRITIEDFEPNSPINIIWFSEQQETHILQLSSEDIDYSCMSYENPAVIIDNLVKNTTYTFCLIPFFEYTVTPFNCLPLYVPIEEEWDDNIWISTDQKQFTVGILCLIFMLSLFFGAVIAYFGIKAYPDLLEGSKNVLVVKKSDQTCYVSTISECDYLKGSSMKKKPLGSSLKKNSLKPPLPETPTSQPPPLYNMSAKSFERLHSSKSSSTCFEDPFTPTSLFAAPISFAEDEYEMPKNFDKKKQYEARCVPNNYGMSPGSPPPLPKRNSNISDTTISIIANRFSKAE